MQQHSSVATTSKAYNKVPGIAEKVYRTTDDTHTESCCVDKATTTTSIDTYINTT
jgi:hypothetical protein